MRTITCFTGPLFVGFAALGVASACSDDARTTFVDPDARDGQASLPEAAADSGWDAAERPDAKEPYAFADEEVTCANAESPCVKEIVAGESHFCARMASGTAYCWGSDVRGNLGRGDSSDGGSGSGFITPVLGLSNVTQLSAGGNTTCARLGDGSVRCWGGNDNAELGLAEDTPTADTNRHATPVTPTGVATAARVEVGDGSVCAIGANGEPRCWGSNRDGKLARPIPLPPPNLPWWQVFVPLVTAGDAQIDIVAVDAIELGTYSAIGRSKSGELWVWGAVSGPNGYLGGIVASMSPSLSPRRIALSDVTSFGASGHTLAPRPEVPPGTFVPDPIPRAHACAISAGEVYCWGRSEKSALCTGFPDPEILPRRAPVVSKAWPQRLALAPEITCVRLTDGAVHCCGSNDKGRLGVPPSTTHMNMFTPVSTFAKHAVQIALSSKSVCALIEDGTVECWGGNENGELGADNRDGNNHPEARLVAF